MGPEALLLKTRKLTNALGYDRFEVTACVEDSPAALRDSNDEGNIRAQVAEQQPDDTKESAPEVAEEYEDGFEIINERLESIETKLTSFIRQSSSRPAQDTISEIIARLKDSDCDENDIQELIANPNNLTNAGGSVVFEKAVNDGLANLLTQIIESRLEIQNGDRAIVFGPAGSGKTSFAAKLSAHLLLKYRLKVSPELLEFTQADSADSVPVRSEHSKFCHSNGNGDSGTGDFSAGAVLVIDTPSFPQDKFSLEKLLDQFQELQPTHRFFVFSALTRNADLQEMAEILQLLQPTHLVMTMTDLTGRYGSILSVARKLNCRLAFITDSPGGIGEIIIPDPNELANAIMNREEELCKS